MSWLLKATSTLPGGTGMVTPSDRISRQLFGMTAPEVMAAETSTA